MVELEKKKQNEGSTNSLSDNEESTNSLSQHETMKESIKIFCFDLTALSQSGTFFVGVTGIMVFFLLYGYVQELIFLLDEFRAHGWYLTLLQFLLYAIFGLIEMYLNNDFHRRVPLNTYLLIALLTVGTMGFSNSALGYLNYPTQVIFKSCKLIPVMIGSMIIVGKRYSLIDVAACICMCIGLIFFTLADSQVQPNFNMLGLILINIALVFDAIIGNVQEKVMKEHKCSNVEMVFYSYGIGFVYLLVYEMCSGELFAAFEVGLQYPMEVYGYATLYSITGYVGINFVLLLVKYYGALLAVTVTTFRKALTVVLSFLFFSKPFTNQYLWSGAIVVLGIYLNIYSKNQTHWNGYLRHWITKFGLVGDRQRKMTQTV